MISEAASGTVTDPAAPRMTISLAQERIVGYCLISTCVVGFIWYLNVFVALVRVLRRFSSFVLITAQCATDLWLLSQFTLRGVALALLATFPNISPRIYAFLYFLGWFPSLLLTTLIAFNRMHLVMAPLKHEHTWTRRVVLSLTLLSVLLGVLVAVVFCFCLNADDKAYNNFVPASFVSDFDDDHAKGVEVVFWVHLSIHCATIGPSVIVYLLSILLTLYTRFFDTNKSPTLFTLKTNRQWEGQKRLWIICFFNFAPSLGPLLSSCLEPSDENNAKLVLATTFYGVANAIIASVLLTLLSREVRQNLLVNPFRRKSAIVKSLASSAVFAPRTRRAPHNQFTAVNFNSFNENNKL